MHLYNYRSVTVVSYEYIVRSSLKNSQKQLKVEVHQINCQKVTSLANEIKAASPRVGMLLLNRAARTVNHHGSRPSQLQTLDSTSTNKHSGMLCVCTMVGPSAVFPLTVPVVYPSALITHLHVLRMLSPQSGTTRSETYWQTSSLKCVHVLQLSLHYSPSVVNNFNFVPPTLRTMQG